MKLCFLAPANSIHSYRWVTYFADCGHDVAWLSLHPLTFDPPKNVTFHYIGMGLPVPLNYICARRTIKRYLNEARPDILHIHSLNAYGVGALNDFQPLVVTAWGSDVLYAHEYRARKKFVQHIIRRARCVTCDALHMKRAILELVPECYDVEQINFGIDISVFRPRRMDPDMRNRLGIGLGMAMVSLRSLYPVYDIAALIRCVPLVVREMPSAKFFIAGTGPEEDSLRGLVKSLNVSQNVIFLGKVENELLPMYLSQMDVYVSTALSDAGIAASTAEAMACGLPVVVTDTGENRFWVQDGRSGFVVPPRQHESIAEKVLVLLRDAPMRQAFGAAGRAVIEERNNYRREMGKMETIYRRLMS